MARVPGERTEVLGIDRPTNRERRPGGGPRHRASCARPSAGYTTLITEFVGGRHATDNADFVRPPRLEQIVAALRTFHTSGPIAGTFPIHRVVEWHARDAAAHGVEPPPIYHWLHERSVAIEDAFNTAPLAPVPCHNDLLPANVLFDDDRVWILDFEYAGMNDALRPRQPEHQLGVRTRRRRTPARSYFGGIARRGWPPAPDEDHVGVSGGHVGRGATGDLDARHDFVAYADERLGNCRQLIENAPFEAWLVDASGPVGG